MSFQISQEQSDNNGCQIFFTQHSELEDRLDPLFYIAIQNIKKNILEKAKYPCIDLIKTCSINRGRFGHRPRNDPKFYGGEYPFIQTGDIVQASFNNTSIEYTQTLNELGLQTSKLFKPPQLLFTIAANIGDTAILDFESCFPDSIVSLVPKNTDISIEYLNYYLKLIKPYVIELAPYSAQRNLNNQQLAQVPIIVPPEEIQKTLVSMMDKAYLLKKQKEAQAQHLLDSIDDYLLGELGIKLPKQEENTLVSRIFTLQLSEVSGGRFDPKLYDPKTRFLKTSISESKFNTTKLKHLLIHKVSGDWGKDLENEDKNIYSKTLVIRATEYDNSFNLNLDNSRLKYRNIKKNKLKDMSVKENDLLIEKSGGSPDQPVGRVAIINKIVLKKFATIGFSNFILKIRVDNLKVSANYVYSYLKTAHSIGLTDAMQSQTNGIRNLILGDYFNQLIPLPPLEKQTEIANKIKEIRQQAKQLQQEASADLEQAKKEVEAMILGEA